MDSSLQVPVPGTFQVRILEGVAISSSRGSFWSRDQRELTCIGRWFLYFCVTSDTHRECMKGKKVAQSCPTLCNPIDCSPPGSSIHGIFQARVLGWVAISFSRGSSWPRDRTQVSGIAGTCFYCLSHQGSVHNLLNFWWWENPWFLR